MKKIITVLASAAVILAGCSGSNSESKGKTLGRVTFENDIYRTI